MGILAMKVAECTVQEILKTELSNTKYHVLRGSEVRITNRSDSGFSIVHFFTGFSPSFPAALKWILVSRRPRLAWLILISWSDESAISVQPSCERVKG